MSATSISQRKPSATYGELPKNRRPTLLSRIATHIARRSQDMLRLCAHAVRPATCRSGLLSSIYYLCISSAFRREQQALLAGIEKYHSAARYPTEDFALLRRNTHRLEKGLLMTPRRDVFAVEYITETVDCYASVIRNTSPGEYAHSHGLIWAHDVLTEYFRVAGLDRVVDAAREKFNRLVDPSPNRCEADYRIPYRRGVLAAAPVSIEDLTALARRRRSVRRFRRQEIPREMIDRAIEVAGQSPCACNRQPFVFRVLDDPQLVNVASVIPMGTAGYADNIPVIVVVVGQQRHFFDERDRHLIYIDSSLAVMGFVYALEAQGLSSSCINWPDIEEREALMAKLLKLESDERPIMCVAIGYPDADAIVAYSQKKPLEQLRRYNFE